MKTEHDIRNHGTKGATLVTSAAAFSGGHFCAIAVIGTADLVVNAFTAESLVDGAAYTGPALAGKTIPKGVVLPIHGTALSVTSGECLVFLA